MNYYIVDAFTSQLFKGNQAGVCPLDEWLPDELMQSIASENNMSETAFFVKQEGYYDLRWFTPESEIDLCGHATLASAFILYDLFDEAAPSIEFHTMSGVLTVERAGDLLEMDFPTRRPEPMPILPQMSQAIGAPVLEAYLSRDMLLILENEQQVKQLEPDMDLVATFPDCLGVIVSAPGESVDFVSRFFAPGAGIAEDPVTGSSHCTLIPYWSERLGKNELIAQQLSKRGGTLYCKYCNDRVKIAGKATLYLTGTLHI